MTATLRPDGKTRFLIFGWDSSVFSGIFMTADQPISGISNLFASDANSQGVAAEIITLSPPDDVTLDIHY